MEVILRSCARTHARIRLFRVTHSLASSRLAPFTHAVNLSHAHSLTHSLTHSDTKSLRAHSLTHSLTNPTYRHMFFSVFPKVPDLLNIRWIERGLYSSNVPASMCTMCACNRAECLGVSVSDAMRTRMGLLVSIRFRLSLM